METEAPDIETKARNLGWVPQDQWTGDPEHWVDHETFVSRGEQIMPILRKNNEQLQTSVTALKAQLDRMTAAFESSQKSVGELKEFYEEQVKDKVKQVRAELTQELKAARESGDVEREVEIQDELAGLRTSVKQAQGETPPTPPTTSASAQDPEFSAWLSQPENAWYGKDTKKTALALGIGQELRADPANNGLTGRAFYDRVAQEVERFFTPTRVSKVSGGSAEPAGAGSGVGGSGSRYSELPAEAKQHCDKQAVKFVGENKPFKTIGEWRANFSSLYFSGDES